MKGKEEANTDAEELRNAISKYKSTIQLAELKKMKYISRVYQESKLKKVNQRNEDKLSLVNSLITPSLLSLRLTNIYEQLRKVCRVYELSLNIIPTLFLPNPSSYIFTNSRGIVELVETQNSFQNFFNNFRDINNTYSYPEYILKRNDKKPVFFQSVKQAQNYISEYPHTEGMLQKFIQPKTDKLSITRVLWKNQKYAYYLIANKKKVAKRNRSHSMVSLISKEKVSKGSTNPDGRKDTEKKLTQKPVPKIPSILPQGLLQRLQNSTQTPWKSPKPSFLTIPKADTAKFTVGSQSLAYSFAQKLNISSIEIETMTQTVLFFIKRFLVSEKSDISELVCDFIRDSNKAWMLLNCSHLRVTHCDFKEIFRIEPENPLMVTRLDSDSDKLEDTSVLINQISLDKDMNKPLSHTVSLKSEVFFNPHIDSNFQNKFNKTLTKIDRIRRKNRLNSNVANRYELVQDYKSYFNIDRYGGVPGVMLSHSNVKPFLNKLETRPTKSPESSSAERFNRLYSASKSYDSIGAMDMINKYTAESVESYETIIRRIKQSEFPTMNLDHKYGGPKFLLVFYEDLMKQFQNSCLCKYIWVKDEIEVMCPGLHLMFNCKVNLALAKLLFNKHSKLAISKDEYEVFTEIFLNVAKEYDFEAKEFEFITSLMQKLSRDIITRRISR